MFDSGMPSGARIFANACCAVGLMLCAQLDPAELGVVRVVQTLHEQRTGVEQLAHRVEVGDRRLQDTGDDREVTVERGAVLAHQIERRRRDLAEARARRSRPLAARRPAAPVSSAKSSSTWPSTCSRVAIVAVKSSNWSMMRPMVSLFSAKVPVRPARFFSASLMRRPAAAEIVGQVLHQPAGRARDRASRGTP